MMAYVLTHNERFLIHSNDPVWNHYEAFKWWPPVHGVAGACVLFLGPLQFSDRLRRRYMKLHRVVGKIYVAGVLIGAPIGAFIQYRFDERLGMTRSFTVATVGDASLWLLTTAIALAFALSGKIQQEGIGDLCQNKGTGQVHCFQSLLIAVTAEIAVMPQVTDQKRLRVNSRHCSSGHTL
jgi:hypothetical protein